MLKRSMLFGIRKACMANVSTGRFESIYPILRNAHADKSMFNSWSQQMAWMSIRRDALKAETHVQRRVKLLAEEPLPKSANSLL